MKLKGKLSELGRLYKLTPSALKPAQFWDGGSGKNMVVRSYV